MMNHSFTPTEEATCEQLGLLPYKRYSVAEVSMMLGQSVGVVRRLRQAGQIEIVTVGKRVFSLGGHIARYVQGKRLAIGIRAPDNIPSAERDQPAR